MLIEREQAILPLLDTACTPNRPVFPSWVLTGTSVNEGLVKPALGTSSKHDLFIFMPTVQIIMNYLSGRVRIQGGRQRFNLYLSLISPYGKFFKSSAAELAQSYCRQAGMLGEGGPDVHSPDYVVLQECGSAEGFCMRMRQMNGKRARRASACNVRASPVRCRPRYVAFGGCSLRASFGKPLNSWERKEAV